MEWRIIISSDTSAPSCICDSSKRFRLAHVCMKPVHHEHFGVLLDAIFSRTWLAQSDIGEESAHTRTR